MAIRNITLVGKGNEDVHLTVTEHDEVEIDINGESHAVVVVRDLFSSVDLLLKAYDFEHPRDVEGPQPPTEEDFVGVPSGPQGF